LINATIANNTMRMGNPVPKPGGGLQLDTADGSSVSGTASPTNTILFCSSDQTSNKRQNRGRDLVADVKRIQRAGLEVQGGFIVGFDHDTPTIFQRQIEFIQRSGIVTAMVGLLQAEPGTKLYQRLNRQGRMLGDTTGDNVDGTTNFVPRMDREKLRQGCRLGVPCGIRLPPPVGRV
jgi:hypothetical protein